MTEKMSRKMLDDKCKVLSPMISEHLDGHDFVLVIKNGLEECPSLMSSMPVEQIAPMLVLLARVLMEADNVQESTTAVHVEDNPGTVQ